VTAASTEQVWPRLPRRPHRRAGGGRGAPRVALVRPHGVDDERPRRADRVL